MNYKITVSPVFLRNLKQLAKHYSSIKQDIQELAKELVLNPEMGTPLGRNLRKVRMSITSKGKGKRGGARVITCTIIVTEVESEIKLLTMYDKSDRENITEKELLIILEQNGLL
jgi:hypothetical protein